MISSMAAVHNNLFLTCSNLRNRTRVAGRRMSAPSFSFLSTMQDSSLLKTNVTKKPYLWKDFSKVQSHHQNDYHQVLRWWEQLELSQQPQDFRKQPMKWFACSMGLLPDPEFSMQRIELSKVIALIYVIDDIFDLLGSLEELTLFTQSVERLTWSASL